MNRFAELLDRLAYEPGRNAKLRLIADYLRSTPDPERGWALAALTGALTFKHAKAGMIRGLIAERTDPALFALSYDYVGDLSETVALMWPLDPDQKSGSAPTLSEVVQTLSTLGKAQLPAQDRALARWSGRNWPLGTAEAGHWRLADRRVGTARKNCRRVARQASRPTRSKFCGRDSRRLISIYFAWLEGRAEKPSTRDPAPFRPPMLAHAAEEAISPDWTPRIIMAEWKWDGIRVQAVAGRDEHGELVARLYSRTGEEISKSFPDLRRIVAPALRDRRRTADHARRPRAILQRAAAAIEPQSGHAKAAGGISRASARLRSSGGRRRGSARASHSCERRDGWRNSSQSLNDPRIDISPLMPFKTWDELTAARADPASAGAGADADAVEGVMLKRRDAPYVPGRPKGPWWKWKRDPMIIDAVLMYAQRGHGKRSSYYSDYTFGVWTKGENGEELVPVGKAYFGFTDEELIQIDRFVRRNTVDRFGPVREVAHEPKRGWCWKLPSRDCSARRVISPASPCGFRASTGCAGTSRRATPTGWRHSSSMLQQREHATMAAQSEAIMC